MKKISQPDNHNSSFRRRTQAVVIVAREIVKNLSRVLDLIKAMHVFHFKGMNSLAEFKWNSPACLKLSPFLNSPFTSGLTL